MSPGADELGRQFRTLLRTAVRMEDSNDALAVTKHMKKVCTRALTWAPHHCVETCTVTGCGGGDAAAAAAACVCAYRVGSSALTVVDVVSSSHQLLATYVGTSVDAAFDFPTFAKMVKEVMRGRRLDTAVSG